ncbi:MAG: TonB-dependent receptor plug domain-containing protein [Sphingomonas sp.]
MITGLGLDGGSDNQPNIQLHDMERIEILKGPQGTLFGAGSMSGTVRFITNKPDLDTVSFSAAASGASVKGGNFLYGGEAVANLPIVEDALGARAVVWSENGGGYIDQTRRGIALEDVNDQTIWGGRVMLASKIADSLTVAATALYQKSKADGAQYFEFGRGAYNNVSPTLEPFEDEIKLFSGVAEYASSFGVFTGTVSYLDRQLSYSRDSTPTATRYNFGVDLAYHQAQDISNLSSELRFASAFTGPVQIVAGLFYSKLKSASTGAALVADPATGRARCEFHEDCVAAGLANDDISSATDNMAIDQYAAFSQLEYKLTDALRRRWACATTRPTSRRRSSPRRRCGAGGWRRRCRAPPKSPSTTARMRAK